jgi:drug/metabolite transporter (DMT)-like permease
MARNDTTGVMLAGFAALLWSPHVYVARIALQDNTNPLVFYFYVLLWAALACGLVMLIAGNMGELSVFNRRETRFLLLALTGGYAFWVLAGMTLAKTTSRPHMQLFFYLGPLIVGLLSLLGRESADGPQFVVLMLGFVGCIMIAQPPRDISPGIEVSALALGAAACWAIFTLGARSIMRYENAVPVATIIWTLGAACLFVTCLSTGASLWDISSQALGYSAFLGIVTVAFGFSAWLSSLSLLPPAYAAPVWYIALIMGILWGWISGSTPGWWSLGGTVLILLAIRGRSAPRRAGIDVQQIMRS